jgi:hypothetical protein
MKMGRRGLALSSRKAIFCNRWSIAAAWSGKGRADPIGFYNPVKEQTHARGKTGKSVYIAGKITGTRITRVSSGALHQI